MENYKIINGKRVKYSENEYQEYLDRINNENLNNKELYNNNVLSKLKNDISQEIYKVYPISKQIDIIARIGGYSDNDFNEMKKFIEEKIEKYKKNKNTILI